MILRTALSRTAPPTLWGSAAARELLEHNGLGDVESVFARARPERYRHAGRAVAEQVLTDASGCQTRAFIKLYFGPRRWWPRMTDIKTGQVWQSLPLREWHGIERLAALGLDVPPRLGLFRRGLLRLRAAVVLGAVPAPRSLDELLSSGAWQRLDGGDRAAILDEVAAIARRIHSAGLAWRGIDSRHYFPAQRPDGRWRCWLIDCEGVHRRSGPRAIARDYARLLRSFAASGADNGTIGELERRIRGGANRQ